MIALLSVVGSPAHAAAPRADGRTVVAVPLPDDLDPATLWLTCQGAAPLPLAPGSALRAILPARGEAETAACTIHGGGAPRPVPLAHAPAGPGLYLEGPGEMALSGAHLAFRSLAVDSAGVVSRPPLTGLHAVGGAATVDGARVSISLAEDRVPRPLVATFTDGNRLGALFLPVGAEVPLPIWTRGGSEVTVRIGRRDFGPVRARASRAEVRVEVPVVVPPGAREASVRAVDDLGNARTERTPLDPPLRPRVSAITTDPAPEVGARLPVLVAVAAVHGGPGGADEVPRLTTDRGSVSEVRPAGPGLWRATYRAPPTPGPDAIQIRLGPGDSPLALTLDVRRGSPAVVKVSGPRGPHGPGAVVPVTATVHDLAGNHLPRVETTVQVADEAARPGVSDEPVPVRLPLVIPRGGATPVTVAAGAVTGTWRIPMEAGAPTTAGIEVLPEGRRARVVLRVADLHGNAVPADRFWITVEEATAGPVVAEEEDALALTVEAAPRARQGRLRLSDEAGRPLAEAALPFAPPPGAWFVGAFAQAAIGHHGGERWLPRVGVGGAVRKRWGDLQVMGRLGLDGVVFADETEVTWLGDPVTLSRRLTAVTLHPSVGVRRPLGGWGLELGGGPTLALVQSRTRLGDDPPTVGGGLTPGLRLEGAVDLRAGPGRLSLRLRWGTGGDDTGPVSGALEGWGLLVGWRVWLADYGS